MGKDFGPIESDYDFFMSHATEAESDVAHFGQELAEFAQGRERIRLLDFGCGTGEFSDRFLCAMRWPPAMLQITLLEPVAAQRTQAAKRVARFTQQPVTQLSQVTAAEAGQFDLILVNHVLYYVDDLDATLSQLLAALAPGGRLLIAMAGWENALLKFWQLGFALLKKPIPYYAADDVRAFLAQRRIAFRQTTAPYQLAFSDSTDNRLKILRFLFADNFTHQSSEPMLAFFAPYLHDGQIVIETESEHLVVTIDSITT
jgi:trans-aconitate 2-methyltransferase